MLIKKFVISITEVNYLFLIHFSLPIFRIDKIISFLFYILPHCFATPYIF